MSRVEDCTVIVEDVFCEDVSGWVVCGDDICPVVLVMGVELALGCGSVVVVVGFVGEEALCVEVLGVVGPGVLVLRIEIPDGVAAVVPVVGFVDELALGVEVLEVVGPSVLVPPTSDITQTPSRRTHERPAMVSPSPVVLSLRSASSTHRALLVPCAPPAPYQQPRVFPINNCKFRHIPDRLFARMQRVKKIYSTMRVSENPIAPEMASTSFNLFQYCRPLDA
jgi:hypothetical protein